MIFSSLGHLFKLSVFGKVARFGGNYALSWILFPEDFGILALAIAYSQVVLILRTSGLQAYFVQNYETEEKRLFSTVFLADIVMSAVLAVAITVVAQILITYGFIEASVRDIMMLMGGNILVAAFSGVYFFNLKKKLEFKSLSNITIAADIISAGSKVGTALLGFGALSFILGEVLGNIFKFLYSFRSLRASISLSQFDYGQTRQIFWYVKHSLLQSSAEYVILNFDKLLLFRIAGLIELGKYSFALTQVTMLFSFFAGPIRNLLLSALPKFYGHRDTLSAWITSMQLMCTAAFVPFFAFLVFHSQLLVDAIYAEKWSEAYVFMSVFSLQFLIRSTTMCIMPVLVTQKRPDISSKFKLLKAVMVFLFVLISYGLSGDFIVVVYSFVTASVLSDLIQSFFTVRKFDIDVRRLILSTLLLISSTLSLSFLSGQFFEGVQLTGVGAINFLLEFLVFGAAYFLLIRVFLWTELMMSFNHIRHFKDTEPNQ